MIWETGGGRSSACGPSPRIRSSMEGKGSLYSVLRKTQNSIILTRPRSLFTFSLLFAFVSRARFETRSINLIKWMCVPFYSGVPCLHERQTDMHVSRDAKRTACLLAWFVKEEEKNFFHTPAAAASPRRRQLNAQVFFFGGGQDVILPPSRHDVRIYVVRGDFHCFSRRCTNISTETAL